MSLKGISFLPHALDSFIDSGYLPFQGVVLDFWYEVGFIAGKSVERCLLRHRMGGIVVHVLREREQCCPVVLILSRVGPEVVL